MHDDRIVQFHNYQILTNICCDW